MAVIENTYTGNGSTTLYSFTFPYISESDIKISLDGTSTTAFTLANATTIEFTTAPASGVAIRIYRVTSSDSITATFFAGSAIRAQDLNNNFNQTLYSTQEVVGRAIDNNNAIFNGDVDLNSNKIVNLANGTASTDAVNKSQLDATQTYNDTQLTTAVTNAQAAQTAAETAKTAAETAETNAETAETNAETAQTAAETAATNAATSATNAAASAVSAASFAGSTVFFGFRRTANSNLVLDFSSTAENATYATADYEVKGGSQWYIGSNDVLHQSGPNLGQPRFSFNADGHLILSDT